MSERREYTVFLASPSSDTLDARDAVARVVHRINVDLEATVHLRLLRWDDPDRSLALSAETNGQVDVIEQVGHPAKCDLVIGIIRHTMGGRLPPERFPHPGGRAWHCTEWEIDQGLQGLAAGTVRTVWRFRDVADFPGRKARQSDAEWAAIDARHRAVSAYFQALNPEPELQRQSVNEYEGVDDLSTKLDSALRGWVKRQLAGPPAQPQPRPFDADALTTLQQTLLARLLSGEAPGRDDADRKLAARALAEPVTGWRSHLLRRCAAWCTGTGTGMGGQLDRRFVNLTLMVDRLPGVEGERFVADASRRGDGRYDDLAELLADQPDAGAWLLVGDPGSGKSTVLQHHELATARAALRAIAAGERPPELCFWVRLSDYGVADAEPAEWLAQRWAAAVGQALPAWGQACEDMRIRVLADGLNEIKAPDPAAQGQAMQRWAAWAARMADAGGQLPPVFSVRTLEIGDGLQRSDLALRYIRLGLWTDAQIEAYCQARGAGAVWASLGRPEAQRLRELCRLPFNLAAQCELFDDTGELAQDRAELLSGVVWQRVIHEHRKGAAGGVAAAGLLGPRDRDRIGNGHWRRALRALPEQGWLVRGLDALAEQLQRDGRDVSFGEGDALAAFERCVAESVPPPGAARHAVVTPPQAVVTPPQAVVTPPQAVVTPPQAVVTPPQAAVWLKAAQALDFIGVSAIDKFTGATSLRYTHQLWQEFFAGRRLRERAPAAAGSDAAALPDFSPPALAPMAEVLARLGTQDPLPVPAASPWEEPVKLAVQLSTRPLDWLRHLLAVNLPLAGRAAADALARLEADAAGRALLTELRAALLARSRDAGADLRLRVEAAEALGHVGDPRYVTAQGPHGSRYHVPLPAHWVDVPAGVYRIGSDDGDADEKPVTAVALEPFQVSFAPVTNAEFRCFVDAGGYDDERWWEGETTLRWLREGIRNEAEIERVGNLFAGLRTDFDATVRRHLNLTEATIETLRTFASLTEADANAQIDRWYGAQTFRVPQEWANPRFNQANQPVVGICLYEAQAYCRWLSAQTGRTMHLPTEAQWEAAARGSNGRRWPWGDAAPAPGQINDDAAHLRRTSPVGVFPPGDTPDGLVDLSGNVWEWTSSRYTDRLEAQALTVEAPPDGSALRAVRGGSWDDRSGYCRLGYRYWFSPVFRYDLLGFRVVCCPIQDP